ncbi:MAG: hypothetical protein ACK5HY_15370, partial [Parahaliea sp.]
KKPVTKADLRADLEQATEHFLRQGGTVTAVPRGTSGRDPFTQRFGPSERLFAQPRTPRTPVPEVVAAIEERRKARQKPPPSSRRTRASHLQRKVIYDDFGEPLRRVWDEG